MKVIELLLQGKKVKDGDGIEKEKCKITKIEY